MRYRRKIKVLTLKLRLLTKQLSKGHMMTVFIPYIIIMVKLSFIRERRGKTGFNLGEGGGAKQG
jgi:hypothetical protein